MTWPFYRSQTVELGDIGRQDFRLGALGQVGPRFDRMEIFRIFAIPMRQVGGEDNIVVAESADNFSQRFFARLDRDIETATLNVFTRRVFAFGRLERAALFPLFV